MSTAVCITDRDEWRSRTDNIAVVDPEARSVLWVPRDLYSPLVGDRINTAFARGGHALLRASLRELGIGADHSLCLRRGAVEQALAAVDVTVPVERPLRFLYPITPTSRIEDGSKLVTFQPPEERLVGERVHQWLGARVAAARDSGTGGDLARIQRQQVFVRALLESGSDLSAVVADREWAQSTSADAVAEVAAVRSDWRFVTLDNVVSATVHGMDVLVRRSRPRLVSHLGSSKLARSLRQALRKLLFAVASVPTWGLGAPPRRVRLLALLAVRDEARFLPGFLANVAPHVDGIVALDDGSTDGSRELLHASPAVLEVIRIPADRPAWDEVGNYRRLHAAALAHGADWLVSLDADERVERSFRVRAERAIRRGGVIGLSAFTVRVRELWGAPDRFRSDGRWGRKRIARLFAALPDHRFDLRPLHATKAPLQARIRGSFVCADLMVYHLRTIRRDDRAARRARYERLDPQALWQPDIGYEYLTDESGLRLRRVGRRRGWEERA